MCTLVLQERRIHTVYKGGQREPGEGNFSENRGGEQKGGEIGIIKGIQGNKVENVLDVVEREKTGLREKVSSQK